jgi:arylsulfatase A-like enzyme
MSKDRPSQKPVPVNLLFICSATFLVGIAGAALFGTLDVTLHMGDTRVADLVQAVLLWALIGGFLAMATSLMVAVGTWLFGNEIPRSQLVAILIGLAVQIVALLTLNTLTAVILLPLAWVIAARLSRIERLGQIDHLATLCLATLLSLVLAVGGLSLFGSPTVKWQLFCTVFVLGLLWLTYFSAERYPRWTRRVLGLIFVVVLVPLLGPRLFSGFDQRVMARHKRTGPPNVVLIVLDTTRADHIGAYGHRGNLTPNLDRLGVEGTLYENAISPAEWTVPSHASLFTGLYPVTHGASFAQHRWLDDEFVTLAEMMKGEGYQTVGLSANPYIHESNLDQGIDHYVFLQHSEPSKLHRVALAVGFPRRWADKGSTLAVEEFERWLHGSYDPERPFFLFINLMEPHWRYFPPWRQRAAHLPDGVGYWEATRLSARFYGVNWLAGQRANGQVGKAIRALYAGEVAYQDEQVGRLVTMIRESIDLENTLLIITADHGENLGEANRWDHVFAVNDYLIHVPLVIRYPKRFPVGRRLPGQVQLIDIVPTVYDLLGHPPPVPGLPGRSLVPDRFSPREVTFAESVPFYGHLERMSVITGMQRDISEFTTTLRAIRTERYKYVWSSNGNDALFDLRKDPDEATNILAEEPTTGNHLRKKLLAWWNAQPQYSRPQGDHTGNYSRPLSREQREGLRSLGYVR